jgi:hypothetical protein
VTARPRAGWHAYRPGRRIQLPEWTVELALTVERPAERAPGPVGWPAERAPGPVGSPAEPAPAGLWYPPGHGLGSVERPAGHGLGSVGWPLLLLSSAGRVPLVRAIGQAVGEVELAAGLRRPAALRLPVPALLAGAEPLAPGDVLGCLEAAASRGQPGLARRRGPLPAAESVWRVGPGAVVTCAGRSGVSAQAAIALRGSGDPAAIAPRPGGALLLRAWRVGRRWAMTSALVLGAADTGGLGREAKRCVAELRAGGWAAGVAAGAAALALVRSGDPRCHVPSAVARPADIGEVAVLLTTFLAAARLAGYPSHQ